MIGTVIGTVILVLVFLLPLVVLWIVRPVCGAYDPPDYRCGKCDRCRREKT